MTRDQIMRARMFAQEALNDESECVRIAAEIALRNLPQPPEDFTSLSQPKED